MKESMMTKFQTWYMDAAVFDLPAVLNIAARNLADVDFDTLVGTGFSGSIVIPSLALAMNKKFVLIRKETDDSHHGRGKLVGAMGEKWIFVDDFISSGRTRKRVIERISEAGDDYGSKLKTTMVGQYMYQSFQGFEEFDPYWVQGGW